MNKQEQQLPKDKQTTLGLYVTAAQAYAMWKAAPDEVKLIDVRTPEEYGFIGHPEGAWNIPLAFVTYKRKNGVTEYGPKSNPGLSPRSKKLPGQTTPCCSFAGRAGARPWPSTCLRQPV